MGYFTNFSYSEQATIRAALFQPSPVMLFYASLGRAAVDQPEYPPVKN